MLKQQFPEPIVGSLIFNPTGEVLLIKSYKWRNKFTIPGGHIEIGETMEKALKREVKEETGLDIFDIEFVCVQEFILDDAFWKKKHFIFFDFACKTKNTQIKLNKEGQEYRWVPINKLYQYPIEPYTRQAIKEYKKTLNK